MAAPTPTARSLPAGKFLKEGFRMLITFASNPTVEFWEKSTKPPGVMGGDPIDTTTQHNIEWKTKALRTLKDFGNMTCKCSYDPLMLTRAQQLVNRPDTITLQFADRTTWAFFGGMISFEPDEVGEGTQPMATVTIAVTNWDETNDVEAGPVLTNVSGT